MKDTLIWLASSLSRLELLAGDFTDFSEAVDIWHGVAVVLCVVCGGTAAGLTIGLVPLDESKLTIKLLVGTPEEKNAAKSVLPIVQRKHLLMVTLLLFNAMANEMLPIFLGALVPNYLAVLFSVTLVVLFGEILPSAFFTGADQLIVCSKMIGFVRTLMWCLYPISYPISCLLDSWFGHDSNGYSRDELAALVMMQGVDVRRNFRGSSTDYGSLERTLSMAAETSLSGPNSDIEMGGTGDESSMSARGKRVQRRVRQSQNRSKYQNVYEDYSSGDESNALSRDDEDDEEEDLNGLSVSEVRIMMGVLKLSKVVARDAMVPASDMFMISSSTVLNTSALKDILNSGFSRIPVYKGSDLRFITGYILVKDLILLGSCKRRIGDLQQRMPLMIKPGMGLLDALSTFQRGCSHVALVTRDPVGTYECIQTGSRPCGAATVLGLLTLEDVIERVLQSDIHDETDRRGVSPCLAAISQHLIPRSKSTSALDTVNSNGSISPDRRGSITNPDEIYSGNAGAPYRKKSRPRVLTKDSVVTSERTTAKDSVVVGAKGPVFNGVQNAQSDLVALRGYTPTNTEKSIADNHKSPNLFEDVIHRLAAAVPDDWDSLAHSGATSAASSASSGTSSLPLKSVAVPVGAVLPKRESVRNLEVLNGDRLPSAQASRRLAPITEESRLLSNEF